MSAIKEVIATNDLVVQQYNQVAPGYSFAMTLGDEIVLTDEEGITQFIPKWELWLLTQGYADTKEKS